MTYVLVAALCYFLGWQQGRRPQQFESVLARIVNWIKDRFK